MKDRCGGFQPGNRAPPHHKIAVHKDFATLGTNTEGLAILAASETVRRTGNALQRQPGINHQFNGGTMAVCRHIGRVNGKRADRTGIRHLGRGQRPPTLPLIRCLADRPSRHVSGRQRGGNREFEHPGLILHRLLVFQLHRYRLPRRDIGYPGGKQVRTLLLHIRRMLPGLFCLLIGLTRRFLRLHLALDGPLPHFHGQAVDAGLLRQREHEHAFPPLVAGIAETAKQPAVGNQPANFYVEFTVQYQRRFLPLPLAINKVQLADIVCLVRLCIEWVDKQHQHDCQPETHTFHETF